MNKKIEIGLLGSGTVGTGVIKVLLENVHEITQKIGREVAITKVLVRDLNKKRKIPSTCTIIDDFEEIINDDSIDIVVEVMGGENPAKEYMLRKACSNSK